MRLNEANPNALTRKDPQEGLQFQLERMSSPYKVCQNGRESQLLSAV